MVCVSAGKGTLEVRRSVRTFSSEVLAEEKERKREDVQDLGLFMGSRR